MKFFLMSRFKNLVTASVNTLSQNDSMKNFLYLSMKNL
jgi:hypothetical protein